MAALTRNEFVYQSRRTADFDALSAMAGFGDDDRRSGDLRDPATHVRPEEIDNQPERGFVTMNPELIGRRLRRLSSARSGDISRPGDLGQRETTMLGGLLVPAHKLDGDVGV